MAKSVAVPQFSFLNSCINLLVIDDDPFSLELFKDIVSTIPLYTIDTADTSANALALLRSGKRFHVCILDLGLDDVGNDEFYILRQYAAHCSIMVLTGSHSPSKGAQCIQIGARNVIEKGVKLDTRKFLETVNFNALLNIVNHRYSETNGETLSFATKTLIEKRPGSVTEWADLMRITDRQLRNLWHTASGFSAKQILSVFTILTQAFQYYTIKVYGSEEEKKILESTIDFKKLHSNYNTHKEAISFILS